MIVETIMNSAIHAFILDTRQALAIWAALTTLAFAAFIVLSVTARREWAGVARAGAAWARARRTRLAQQNAELSRFAAELAVAAQRATRTAQRKRDDWLAAQQRLEVAWQAYAEADKAAQRLRGAAMVKIPRTPLTPAEVVDRERHLHRVVTEAYHRQDLSVEQLLDALSRRNGWDPCRHPADQEIAVWRIARNRRAQAYTAAAAVERNAWQEASVAVTSSRHLADEAFAADLAARHAYHELVEVAPQHAVRSRESGVTRRPSMAIH